MARLADIDDIAVTDLYAELWRREEIKHARRRGRRILTRQGTATVDSPGPRLDSLRAGRPVEVTDWELPRWTRNGRVENRRVTVRPDGRVVEMDG